MKIPNDIVNLILKCDFMRKLKTIRYHLFKKTAKLADYLNDWQIESKAHARRVFEWINEQPDDEKIYRLFWCEIKKWPTVGWIIEEHSDSTDLQTAMDISNDLI